MWKYHVQVILPIRVPALLLIEKVFFFRRWNSIEGLQEFLIPRLNQSDWLMQQLQLNDYDDEGVVYSKTSNKTFEEDSNKVK